MRKMYLIVIGLIALFAASLSSHSGLFNFKIQGIENLFIKQVEIFGGSFLFTDLLTASILVSLSVMLLLLAYILLNRRKLENRNKIRNFLLVRYQDLILDELSDNTEKQHGQNIAYFKKIASNPFRRQVFIDQMIDVGLNLRKEKAQHLRDLFIELGLLDDTLKKLRSSKWNRQIKAMKELSFLGIADFNDEIRALTNSSDSNVRIESFIALVRLENKRGGDSFEFLGTLQHPLAVWEQITLHQLMVNYDIKPPDFGRWVLLDNVSVSKFCLKMIREYNQTRNDWKIEKLLYRNDETVRRLAIQVIGDLELRGSLKVLKNLYRNETYENSVEIIQTMGKIADASMIGFLQRVVDFEEDVPRQIEAVKAINQVQGAGEVALQKMLTSDYKNYQIIIKHVLDKRIN